MSTDEVSRWVDYADTIADIDTRLDTIHDYGEDWDRSDISALLTLRRRGHTIAECAQRLGRTPAAVRSKLYRLRKGT